MSLIYHLGYFDSRWRSRETRLAGLKLADWAEVSPTKAVNACNSEPVGLTWSQLLLLSALVVLRSGQLSLEESKGLREDVWVRKLMTYVPASKKEEK